MKIVFPILLILTIPFFNSCNKKHLDLNKISGQEMPNYFESSLLFGTGKEAMTKTNDFIIVTGEIDTADKNEINHIAFVKTKKGLQQLNRTFYSLQQNEITQIFSNENLTINLKYKIDSLSTKYYYGLCKLTNKENDYSFKIIGIEGYH